MKPVSKILLMIGAAAVSLAASYILYQINFPTIAEKKTGLKAVRQAIEYQVPQGYLGVPESASEALKKAPVSSLISKPLPTALAVPFPTAAVSMPESFSQADEKLAGVWNDFLQAINKISPAYQDFTGLLGRIEQSRSAAGADEIKKLLNETIEKISALENLISILDEKTGAVTENAAFLEDNNLRGLALAAAEQEKIFSSNFGDYLKILRGLIETDLNNLSSSPVITDGYIAKSGAVTSFIGKIGSVNAELGGVLNQMNAKLQSQDFSGFAQLIDRAKILNSDLGNDAAGLQLVLNDWASENKKTAEQKIKTKTEQAIAAGFDLAKAVSDYSFILEKLSVELENYYQAYLKNAQYSPEENVGELSQQLQQTALAIQSSNQLFSAYFAELKTLIETPGKTTLDPLLQKEIEQNAAIGNAAFQTLMETVGQFNELAEALL